MNKRFPHKACLLGHGIALSHKSKNKIKYLRNIKVKMLDCPGNFTGVNPIKICRQVHKPCCKKDCFWKIPLVKVTTLVKVGIMLNKIWRLLVTRKQFSRRSLIKSKLPSTLHQSKKEICVTMITNIIWCHTAIYFIMSITRDWFRFYYVLSGGYKNTQ